MRTSLTRAIAGTAIAATALAAATGTAGASTTPVPARAATTVSIAETPRTITAGRTIAFKGVLRSGKTQLGSRTIVLERWSGGSVKKWLPLADKATSAHGVVWFYRTPASTARYELVFTGGPNYKASKSVPVTVVVKPFVRTRTKLGIQASSLRIKPGQQETFTGTLFSLGKPLGQRVVALYRVGPKHALTLVGAGLTNAEGAASIATRPTKTGTYELVYRGSKALAPSASPTLTVRVS
jgi:hypothetical protein